MRASPPQAGAWSERTTKSWYGWQTLVVDTLSLGFFVLAIEANSSEAALAGTVTYFAGGPIVHAGHGEGGKAGQSIGLRLAAPLASAAAGYLVGEAACSARSKNSEFPCPAGFALLGVFAGMVGAVAIDASVIAWQPESRPGASTIRLVPGLALGRTGVHLGLSGEF